MAHSTEKLGTGTGTQQILSTPVPNRSGIYSGMNLFHHGKNKTTEVK